MTDRETVPDVSESTLVWRKAYLEKNWWLVKDGNTIASIRIGNIMKVKATGFYNDVHFNMIQKSGSCYDIEFLRANSSPQRGAFLFDQGDLTIRLEVKNMPVFFICLEPKLHSRLNFKMTDAKNNLISETEFHQSNIMGRSKFTLKAHPDPTLDPLFLAMMNLIGAYLITLMIALSIA